MLLSEYLYPLYTPKVCENLTFHLREACRSHGTRKWELRGIKIQKGNKVQPSFLSKILRFTVISWYFNGFNLLFLCGRDWLYCHVFQSAYYSSHTLIRELFTKKKTLWAKGSFSYRHEMHDVTLLSHNTVVLHICLSTFHWQLASLAVWTAGIFVDGETKVRW